MKKLLLLTLCGSALGMAGSALAQAAGPVGGPPQTAPRERKGVDKKAMQKMQEDLLAKLNLTDDQKSKFKAHQAEMKEKMLALRKGAKGAGKGEGVKEKVKALRKEQQQFMKQTLTKEQMREFMKLRQEAMKDAREKAGAPGAKMP